MSKFLVSTELASKLKGLKSLEKVQSTPCDPKKKKKNIKSKMSKLLLTSLLQNLKCGIKAAVLKIHITSYSSSLLSCQL